MTQGEGCGVVPICNISLAAGQSGVERGRVEAKRSVMKLLAAFYMRREVAWSGSIGDGEQCMVWRGMGIESRRLTRGFGWVT